MGNSTNKKDAQTNAARDFVNFLVRIGEVTAAEVPAVAVRTPRLPEFKHNIRERRLKTSFDPMNDEEIMAGLCCRRTLPSATSLMKEQEVALETFLPVGHCLLTLLSKRSKVVSLFGSGF